MNKKPPKRSPANNKGFDGTEYETHYKDDNKMKDYTIIRKKDGTVKVEKK